MAQQGGSRGTGCLWMVGEAGDPPPCLSSIRCEEPSRASTGPTGTTVTQGRLPAPAQP